jgi:hypothetical protein
MWLANCTFSTSEFFATCMKISVEIVKEGRVAAGCLACVFPGALPSNIHGKDTDDVRNSRH